MLGKRPKFDFSNEIHQNLNDIVQNLNNYSINLWMFETSTEMILKKPHFLTTTPIESQPPSTLSYIVRSQHGILPTIIWIQRRQSRPSNIGAAIIPPLPTTTPPTITTISTMWLCCSQYMHLARPVIWTIDRSLEPFDIGLINVRTDEDQEGDWRMYGMSVCVCFCVTAHIISIT